jgi:hypothetical protein
MQALFISRFRSMPFMQGAFPPRPLAFSRPAASASAQAHQPPVRTNASLFHGLGAGHRGYLQSPVPQYLDTRLPQPMVGPPGQDTGASQPSDVPIKHQQHLSSMASPGAFRPGALAGDLHVGKVMPRLLFCPSQFSLALHGVSGVAYCITAR